MRETKTLIHLFIDDIEIKTTPDHPFWVTEKGWVFAGQLNPGDNLSLYSGGNRKITSIQQEALTHPIKVYNLKVERWHTYFVSTQNILVHNANYDITDIHIKEIIEKMKKDRKFNCGQLCSGLVSFKFNNAKTITLKPNFAKYGSDLPVSSGVLGSGRPWKYHVAVFDGEKVWDPLLEKEFPSIDAFKKYILGDAAPDINHVFDIVPDFVQDAWRSGQMLN